MKSLRIAMLTYSLRPRGGVVHALEVAEALARRGHEVELMALGGPGESFFREPEVPFRIVRYERLEESFDEHIKAMIACYRDGLAGPLGDGRFDLIHSQDCISANAAAELRAQGVVPHVVRTVHHVDAFCSPSLIECQARSILDPDAVLCVSHPWVQRLEREFGVHAGLVRNGVDRSRWRPAHDVAERERDRAAAGFDGHLAVLNVGGIEPRKGSLTLLDAFARLRALLPERDPLLVLVGGATLFDHRHEVDLFRARLAELGIGGSVRVLGSLPDGELEHLYRAADLFAFPSTNEGFGLAALEALACELPVVASDLDAFRTFLEHGCSALLVPVGDSRALAGALARLARSSIEREQLRAGGRQVAASYTWDRAVVEHEHAYTELLGSLPRGPGRVAESLR
jgi:glycosyltransferase-like protein